MAAEDAKRIIRQLRLGETVFTVADALGITPAEVRAILRDPTGSPPLPAPGGGADFGLLVIAKHLENDYAIHPATFDFSQAQDFGPTVELESDHIYEIFMAVTGPGAAGRPLWEIWLTGVPDVVSQSGTPWDGSPTNEDAPFPAVLDQGAGALDVDFSHLHREVGYVVTGGSLQVKARITDGGSQTGGVDAQAAGDLVLSRFMVVVRDLSL